MICSIYTVFKCHINRDKLEYVTSFEKESGARSYCDWKNARKISADNEDTFYNYYYVRGVYCRKGCSPVDIEHSYIRELED